MTALERAKEVIRIMAIVYGSDRSNYTRAERALADLVAEIEAAPSIEITECNHAAGEPDFDLDDMESALQKMTIGKRVKMMEVGE